MRHINIIKNLPVSDLSDEEIVKVVHWRLKAICTVLIYFDNPKDVTALGRWSDKEGRRCFALLKYIWETTSFKWQWKFWNDQESQGKEFTPEKKLNHN